MKKLSLIGLFLMMVSAHAMDALNSKDMVIDNEVGPTREDIEAGRAPGNWRAADHEAEMLERQEKAIQRQEEAVDMLEQEQMDRDADYAEEIHY